MTQLPTYQCPGESYPITRSVHLSRLASFYVKCRDCPSRDERAQFPLQINDCLEAVSRRATPDPLMSDEGVRGVYLNRISRLDASLWARSFAALLWENLPDAPPRVMVALDDRPSSPDIQTGVVTGLIQSGCDVVDIGVCSRPILWYAAERYEADATVHVTGCGKNGAHTGFDFSTRGPIPWTMGHGLERLEEVQHSLESKRPLRQSGKWASLNPMQSYRDDLRMEFHAIRPLRVALISSWSWQTDFLSSLLEGYPCEIFPVAPSARMDVSDQLTHSIGQFGADFGILIRDDGQSIEIRDEQGARVPPMILGKLLTSCTSLQAKKIILTASQAIEGWESVVVYGADSSTVMARSMLETGASIGIGGDRIWFGDIPQRCDANWTLGRLLQALSNYDTPLSVRANEEMEETQEARGK